MPEVSGDDLTLLRTHPHRSKLYMIIQDPEIVLAAQTVSPARGDRTITFDNDVYAGGIWVDYTDLEPGMTIWVGSSAGARDIGEISLISATETVLTVSENWDIAWANDLYLSVLKQWKLRAKQPRQVPDADAGTVAWYMDYATSYTDENENYLPVPILGPHRVVFKENGDATIAFDWSDSYAVKAAAAIDTYLLAAEGGTPDNAASATPTVTYTAASGMEGFLVKVTVTDDATPARAETGYRFAFVVSRTGANAPFSSFEMRSLTGDYDGGGWTASFIVRETDVTEAGFPDGALVVIFAEDWYGATKDSIGGNTANAENILFIGYIIEDSVSYDAFTQEVTFGAQGIVGEMQATESDPMVLEDDDSPADWYEMVDVTPDHVALFVARYLSNLIQITDFTISGDTRETVFWELPGASLYEQINTTIYDDAIFGRLLGDRMSRLWAEIDIQIETTAVRDALAAAPIMEITKPDRRDIVRLSHPMDPRTARIEASGVYYAGGGAEVYAYLSEAPGPSRKRRGAAIASTNLALSSQAQCNNLAGWLLAKQNNPYPEVTIQLAGNYRVFDIVPQEYITLTLLATDNNRGLAWTTEKLIPRSVTIQWRPGDGMFLVNITCEKYAIGAAGQTMELPPDPEGWDFPPFDPWPPPPWPPIIPPPAKGTWKPNVYVATKAKGVYRTADFSGPGGGDPTWVADNVGLDSLAITYACQDPWDPVHYRYVIADDDLYRMYNVAQGVAGTHTKILSSEEARNLMGGDFLAEMFSVEGNINKEGYIYLLAGYGESYATGELYCLRSPDRGATWSAFKIRNGKTEGGRLMPGALKGTSSYDAGEVIYVAVCKGALTAWLLYCSLDNGTIWTLKQATGISNDPSFCWVDPSDQSICYWQSFIAAVWELNQATDHGGESERIGPYWTYDGLPVHVHVWDNKWIRLISDATLWESTDFGVTWKVVSAAYEDTSVLSVCHDAPAQLYLASDGSAGLGAERHVVYVSNDKMATIYGKSGANCAEADGGGDSIPYNCGGLPRTGFMQVWL